MAESTQRLREVLAEARSLAISLGLRTEDVTRAIGSALGCVLETLRAHVTSAAVADALALLAIGHALDAPIDLWEAQNAAARLWRQGSPGGPADAGAAHVSPRIRSRARSRRPREPR